MLETPRGPVTIRLTGEADAEAYRELRLSGLRDHPEAFGSSYAESAARPIEFWRGLLRNDREDRANLVADSAGAPVGMIAVVRMDGAKLGHTANLYSVYVHPEWRGAGLGRALIEACVAWARPRGVARLKLSVVATNADAIALYLRCGFSVYGVDPDVIRVNGVGYDELLMARRLEPHT